RIVLPMLVAATLAAAGAGIALAQAPTAPAKSGADASSSLSAKVGTNVTELKKIDVNEGTGAPAVSGKTVVVHYTGWLYDPTKPDGHGAKFNSSVDRKTPFPFPL